jgi:hypothetical protein
MVIDYDDVLTLSQVVVITPDLYASSTRHPRPPLTSSVKQNLSSGDPGSIPGTTLSIHFKCISNIFLDFICTVLEFTISWLRYYLLLLPKY